ncbi:hypothetical protein [Clostridium sp. LP20]|uniref:hypothetical protein n=1 Tax=Clostridium sp. LP20 TaxID=3418665 RepID=UPI003EE60E58
MKVMRKRKKGSSLLMVLAVAMMIIVLGSTLAGAVIYAMKGNALEKRDKDLVYAAESGVEKALLNVRKNDGHQEDDFNMDTDFADKKITVDVVVTKESASGEVRYRVVSTARDVNDGKSRIVKSIIKQGYEVTSSTGNLLQYSICSNKVNIYYSGSLDTPDTLINSTGVINTQNIGPTGTGAITNPNVSNDNFLIPKIDGYKSLTPVTINSIGDLDTLSSNATSGVKVKTYDIKYGFSATHTVKLYFINAPELNIENNTGLVIDKTVIICSGNINIYNPDPQLLSQMNPDKTFNGINTSTLLPTTTLTSSTLVGDAVNVYSSTFKLERPIYDEGSSLNLIYDTTNPSKNDLSDINKVIGKECDEYDPNLGGTIVWKQIEIDYE